MSTATADGVFPGSVREAAAWYLDRGRHPVPLRPRTKIPVLDKWQTLRHTPADLDRLFPKGTPHNIGILDGEPSGGLLDADLDCRGAIIAGRHLLPPTGMVSGRRGAPWSHWWYVADDPPT